MSAVLDDDVGLATPAPVLGARAAGARNVSGSNHPLVEPEREATWVKSLLNAARPAVVLGETHIVLMMVADPEKCRGASKLMLNEDGNARLPDAGKVGLSGLRPMSPIRR